MKNNKLLVVGLTLFVLASSLAGCSRVQPKVIKAFDKDGNKLWERTEEKPSLFDIQYSVVPNGNIVYAFNVDSYYMNHDESIPESEYHVLSCVSKDGSDVWSHSFEHAIHTPVTFDSNGNLYVGTVSPKNKDSLYSLTSDGQVRWELKNIETPIGMHTISLDPPAPNFISQQKTKAFYFASVNHRNL